MPVNRVARTRWRSAGAAALLATTPLLNRRAAAAKTRDIRLKRYRKALAIERGCIALTGVSYLHSRLQEVDSPEKKKDCGMANSCHAED